jgi:hypothetical protein
MTVPPGQIAAREVARQSAGALWRMRTTACRAVRAIGGTPPTPRSAAEIRGEHALHTRGIHRGNAQGRLARGRGTRRANPLGHAAQPPTLRDAGPPVCRAGAPRATGTDRVAEGRQGHEAGNAVRPRRLSVAAMRRVRGRCSADPRMRGARQVAPVATPGCAARRWRASASCSCDRRCPARGAAREGTRLLRCETPWLLPAMPAR